MATRFARAAGAAAFGVAGKSTASTGAAMKAEVTTIWVLASVLAGATEATGAPSELVWLTAATAGTLFGAVASAFAFANLNGKQRAARVLVSFCAGMLLAPFAAAHIPRADSVPLVAHVFSVSGLCSFLAWALVRAVQKRMGGIADSLIDRVAGRQDRKDEHEDGGP